MIFDQSGDAQPIRQIIIRLLTFVQLLVLFWISYNLLQHRRVARGSVITIICASVILAFLFTSGVTRDEATAAKAAVGKLKTGQDRASVGDANPNRMGVVLSLGMIALTGLAYGQQKRKLKTRVFFWSLFGLMAVGLVRTGSRGALVALIVSLLLFPLSRGNLVGKFKIAVATLLGLAVLLGAAYQFEAFRRRWEKTFATGDLTGREIIFAKAAEMVVDRPLIGWGPVQNRVELGFRLGAGEWDAQNLYLHLLTEVGIVGAIPFFVALGLCLRAAWQARKTTHGVLPLAMLAYYLTVTMKGTYINDKFLWVVFAYSLASSAFLPARSRVFARVHRGVAGSPSPAMAIRRDRLADNQHP
jgi:O-antigen ligase